MKYFGTDGIRGVYGENLTDQLAYRAGLAASQFFSDCFVGMDTRSSGDALVAALSAGLMQGGCNVKIVGTVPTPAISFLAAKHNAGGIMVSASHNPPEYNGLKFFSSKGYKLTAFFESSIEEYIDKPPARVGGGKIISYKEGRDEYISWLIGMAGDLSGKEIALDCAYGAAISVAEEVFTRCGANVKLYAAERDGDRINCGVGALYPEHIESKTTGLGFAFDGDADRLAVTCDGILDGDSVLYNLSLLLSPHGVAGTIMNNIALENELKRKGIEFIRTAVGDKNISEAMRRHRFTLGGEQSGHYIISPSVSGDALFASLMLSKMDDFVRLKLVPQKAASVEASPKVLYCEKFVRAKEECEKRLLGIGRLVVRMSGTEPKIRLMAECEDENLLSEIIDSLSETINICNKELI
ncbi:MAG: phosphoglucosamine mutase [Clostridiales bacterium]|nr:phosphoglucosamine mutase [Clostridiales bacterium]